VKGERHGHKVQRYEARGETDRSSGRYLHQSGTAIGGGRYSKEVARSDRGLDGQRSAPGGRRERRDE
jgi:hypothetical protein